MSERDAVIVLASGTEISIEAAVGDIKRAMEYLSDRLNHSPREEAEEIDGYLCDLGHVIELLTSMESRSR